MEIGLGIALLFAVNAWGILALIGLEKLNDQLANDHCTNFEGKRNETEDQSTDDLPASNDRLI